MRVKCFRLGVVKVELGWGVVIIIQKLTPLYPVKWMNPLESELDPGVQELYLFQATGEGHVGAIGDQTTMLLSLGLQLVISSFQVHLVVVI